MDINENLEYNEMSFANLIFELVSTVKVRFAKIWRLEPNSFYDRFKKFSETHLNVFFKNLNTQCKVQWKLAKQLTQFNNLRNL